MKKFLFLLMAFLGMTQVNAQGINFFEGNWKAVLEKAQTENKLIFIDCYTSWCVPCKKMSQTTFTDKKVAEFYNKNFVCVKLDMEKGEGTTVMNAYKINSFPTLLFLNNEGDVIQNANGFKEPEEFLRVGLDVVNNKDQVIEGAYSKETMGLLGAQLPDFTFIDINNHQVKLSSLKGKYLFIDCWATWCNPCCGELPYLAELEKKFEGKNITFVSISVDRDLNKWKDKVKNENLGGVQLNVNKDNNFVKFFGIQGIPHFILIDPEGKVLNPFMNRPSEEITADILESLVEN